MSELLEGKKPETSSPTSNLNFFMSGHYIEKEINNELGKPKVLKELKMGCMR